MKIGIVCLVYISCDEHLRIAKKSVATFKSKYDLHLYYIINHIRNGNDLSWIDPNNSTIIRQPFNNFAHAINTGADAAIRDKVDYILIPNLDTFFFHDTIDNLVDFAEKHQEAVLWSPLSLEKGESRKQDLIDHPQMTNCPSYACFLISPKTIDTVGYFDPFFHPAYFEDTDYSWRIDSRKRGRLLTTSSQYIHYGSSTTSNSKLIFQLFRFYKKINSYKYLLKWGGPPGYEKYQFPFNNKKFSNKWIFKRRRFSLI